MYNRSCLSTALKRLLSKILEGKKGIPALGLIPAIPTGILFKNSKLECEKQHEFESNSNIINILEFRNKTGHMARLLRVWILESDCLSSTLDPVPRHLFDCDFMYVGISSFQ